MADDIRLGDKAKDVITGYEGIVIGRTAWLSNCDRLVLQAQGLDPNGKPFESPSFDITDCVLVERDPLGLGRSHIERAKSGEAKDTRKTGGPMPTPSRHR